MGVGGYKKVSHKARHGRRKSRPAPHRDHHNPHAISDPITRAMKRENLRQREKGREPRVPWERGEDEWAA